MPTSPPDEPAFDDFALAASETPLAPVIRAEIEAAGGRITFARFMQLALGHPEHGYYSRADLAWGRDGDYETSPEVHPIFGYLWARQIEECWQRLGNPEVFDLVEVGAGSGAFGSAILTWLRDRAPDCFAATRATLLDGSPARLEAQRSALKTRGIEADHRLLDDWLADDQPITGVVLSNEFFDALPVHLVERRGDALLEWYVASEGGAFRLEIGEPSSADLKRYFDDLGLQPGDHARAEVNLAARDLMRRIAARVERGYVISIDYGHEAKDLYASWRRMGTLMAFRDHSPQPDPLATPGLLDLTAHVDFTTLATAGVGFETAPTVSQAEALTVLGLPEAMQAAEARAHEDVARFADERRAAATLTDMEGLGRIRVLTLARGAPLEGLRCLRSITEAYGWSTRPREKMRTMAQEAVHYSDTVIEHFNNPRNAGEMADASVDYFVTNPISGDSIRLYLRIADDRIDRASFLTTGGPASIATASMATELVTGRTLDEATAITRQDLVEAVGGLPPSKIQCSVIAAAAIRNAIAKWRREQHDPPEGSGE